MREHFQPSAIGTERHIKVFDAYPTRPGKRGYDCTNCLHDGARVRFCREIVRTDGYQSIERQGRARCLGNLRNAPERPCGESHAAIRPDHVEW